MDLGGRAGSVEIVGWLASSLPTLWRFYQMNSGLSVDQQVRCPKAALRVRRTFPRNPKPSASHLRRTPKLPTTQQRNNQSRFSQGHNDLGSRWVLLPIVYMRVTEGRRLLHRAKTMGPGHRLQILWYIINRLLEDLPHYQMSIQQPWMTWNHRRQHLHLTDTSCRGTAPMPRTSPNLRVDWQGKDQIFPTSINLIDHPVPCRGRAPTCHMIIAIIMGTKRRGERRHAHRRRGTLA
jgi:hypothetical protein